MPYALSDHFGQWLICPGGGGGGGGGRREHRKFTNFTVSLDSANSSMSDAPCGSAASDVCRERVSDGEHVVS